MCVDVFFFSLVLWFFPYKDICCPPQTLYFLLFVWIKLLFYQQKYWCYVFEFVWGIYIGLCEDKKMWRDGSEIAILQGANVKGRCLTKIFHNTSWLEHWWPWGTWACLWTSLFPFHFISFIIYNSYGLACLVTGKTYRNWVRVNWDECKWWEVATVI